MARESQLHFATLRESTQLVILSRFTAIASRGAVVKVEFLLAKNFIFDAFFNFS